MDSAAGGPELQRWYRRLALDVSGQLCCSCSSPLSPPTDAPLCAVSEGRSWREAGGGRDDGITGFPARVLLSQANTLNTPVVRSLCSDPAESITARHNVVSALSPSLQDRR